MQWLHTWSGRSFGYRNGDNLYSHDGKHVGKFYGDEVYGSNGFYLGEIKDSKLITKISKKNQRKSVYTPYVDRVGYVNHVDYVGYVMYAGYEDFPKLEK